MNKNTIALFFSFLFVALISAPSIISAIDDSLDISIFAKTANEETSIDSKIDIESSIERLPEKLKTVFLLSRIEGFKYSEISEICNISVKAVEKRMSKAFQILRKELK